MRLEAVKGDVAPPLECDPRLKALRGMTAGSARLCDCCVTAVYGLLERIGSAGRRIGRPADRDRRAVARVKQERIMRGRPGGQGPWPRLDIRGIPFLAHLNFFSSRDGPLITPSLPASL